MKKSAFRRPFLAVVLLILFLPVHLFALGEIPEGLILDEAGMAYDAWCLANYGVDRYLKPFPVYLTNYGGGQSAMYAWLAAGLIALTGSASPFVLRLPAMAFGLMTMAFGALAVHEIMGKKHPKAWFAFGLFYLVCPVFHDGRAVRAGLQPDAGNVDGVSVRGHPGAEARPRAGLRARRRRRRVDAVHLRGQLHSDGAVLAVFAGLSGAREAAEVEKRARRGGSAGADRVAAGRRAGHQPVRPARSHAVRHVHADEAAELPRRRARLRQPAGRADQRGPQRADARRLLVQRAFPVLDDVSHLGSVCRRRRGGAAGPLRPLPPQPDAGRGRVRADVGRRDALCRRAVPRGLVGRRTSTG